jgi:hypothetical protein
LRSANRREQPDLQRRQLLRAPLELDPALVGLHARADQVLEDEQHDREQPDGADADAAVAERDGGGEQRGRELERQHGHVDRVPGVAEAHPAREVEVQRHRTEVAGVHQHVDEPDERREPERV